MDVQGLSFTQRDLKEIAHSIHYYRNYQHGTVGHNLLVIVGKLALDRGFDVNEAGAVESIVVPPGVTIEDVR